MVFEMPLGVMIIACLNILTYSLLFAESIVHRDWVHESYEKFTHHLPVLGIQNVTAYSTVCLIMSLISVCLVFGLVLKRPLLIWPWMLTAFHVLGNYGYLMLSYVLEWIEQGITNEMLQRFFAPAIIFVIQLWLYIVVFRYFRRIVAEDVLSRTNVPKRF